MKVNSIISDNSVNFEKIIGKVLSVLPDNSSTFMAIRDKYKEKYDIKDDGIIPFSSERKFSACKIGNVSYYVGAPEYVLSSQKELISEEIRNKQNDYRVLVIASRIGDLVKKPMDLKVEGYILIEDEIRREAKDTLDFFKEQGVIVKIISGDNYKTVNEIARKVGLKNLNGIDCTDLTDDNLDEIVKNNDIFGRVTPQMKKKLVQALKRNGYTVAMTGDGVNDVLALREADCSVAMASGSDAAKSVSQLVLLDSNFASMPKIVAEGRRNINNIERSSSLLLVKTIYTILLILTCIVTSTKYFFVPIQLTLITSCTIGIPSFILALEPNHNLVDGKNFLVKIIKKSLPGGLTVMLNGIIILLFKKYFNIDESITNALAVLITGVTGFIHLAHVSKPFNYLRGIMFALLLVAFLYGVVFQNEFFVLNTFNGQIGLIFFLLIVFSIFAYRTLLIVVDYLFNIKTNIKHLLKK
jgi:cation-transporting ATPase E